MLNVFVYGTLKRGRGNNRLLKHATFLGEARTIEPYLLADGGFPRMAELPRHASRMLVQHSGHVCGEVYRVDATTLADLDRLEGHPDFYRRKPLLVTLKTDDPVEGYVWPSHVGLQLIRPFGPKQWLTWPVAGGR